MRNVKEFISIKWGVGTGERNKGDAEFKKTNVGRVKRGQKEDG